MHHARLELHRGVAFGLIGALQLREEILFALRQRDAVLRQLIQQAEQLAGNAPQVGIGKPAARAQRLIQGGGAASVGNNGGGKGDRLRPVAECDHFRQQQRGPVGSTAQRLRQRLRRMVVG